MPYAFSFTEGTPTRVIKAFDHFIASILFGFLFFIVFTLKIDEDFHLQDALYFVLFNLIFVFLVYKATSKSNWARHLLFALAVFGVLSVPTVIPSLPTIKDPGSAAILLIFILSILFNITGVYLLYTKESCCWYSPNSHNLTERNQHPNNIEDSLKNLNELKNKQLISQEEYEVQRSKIIGRI